MSAAFVKEQTLTMVTKLVEHGADLCQGKIKDAKQPGMLPLMVAVSGLYKANYKYVEDCHADTQTAVLELLEAVLLGVRCRIVRQRQRVRRSKSSPQQPGGGGGAEGYVLRVGDVVHAKLIARGCGIVEFETPEDARRAILELNDSELEGRPLQVREDREDRDLK